MKRKLPFILITVFIFGSLFFWACKQSEGSGVVPTYKDSGGTSTGANPHISTAGSQTSTT